MTSLALLESLVVNSGYLTKFDPKDEDDQRKIENIRELKSVAASFTKLADFLENIALVQQEYSLQEKNKKKENRDGVRLMTFIRARVWNSTPFSWSVSRRGFCPIPGR